VVLDPLIDRFEEVSEPELRIQVALALRNNTVPVYRLDREEEARTVHDYMVTRFGEDALAGFDELVKRYAKATEPHMRELVVSMLHGKTVVLRNLGRRGEALPVLNELITCFQDDENTNIQMVVSDARERRKETINEKE
jgi:hypothetical protein